MADPKIGSLWQPYVREQRPIPSAQVSRIVREAKADGVSIPERQSLLYAVMRLRAHRTYEGAQLPSLFTSPADQARLRETLFAGVEDAQALSRLPKADQAAWLEQLARLSGSDSFNAAVGLNVSERVQSLTRQKNLSGLKLPPAVERAVAACLDQGDKLGTNLWDRGHACVIRIEKDGRPYGYELRTSCEPLTLRAQISIQGAVLGTTHSISSWFEPTYIPG